MAKKNETHISVTIETKAKLKELAKEQGRSMRTVITRLIDKACAK